MNEIILYVYNSLLIIFVKFSKFHSCALSRCVGTPHLIIHSSSDGHVSFLDLSLQWNENSESNVVKSVLLIFMTVKILMKTIRVKQKRDFWKRNKPTNKKRSEKKTLFSPSGMLRILFWHYNRRGILSSPLILYPLTVHLFLSTISDKKKKVWQKKL